MPVPKKKEKEKQNRYNIPDHERLAVQNRVIMSKNREREEVKIQK